MTTPVVAHTINIHVNTSSLETIERVEKESAAGALKDTRHEVEHDVSETRVAEIKESIEHVQWSVQ